MSALSHPAAVTKLVPGLARAHLLGHNLHVEQELKTALSSPTVKGW